MPTDPSPSERETFPQSAPPRCVVVTGPLGAGKTRWLQSQITDLLETSPAARCAVLLAEEGRTRLRRLVQDAPGVTVRRLMPPCACCPTLGDLPGAVRALVAAVHPNWLFIEVPAVTAAGLWGEFDRALGWPREIVVCLDRAWIKALREQSLSPFQLILLEFADRVVESSIPGGIQCSLMDGRISAIHPQSAPP